MKILHHFLLFSSLFLGLTTQAQNVVTARVFIHGTVLAGYFFVDIPASWKDEYKENSLIERAMSAARMHPFLYRSELVLDLGITDITSEVTTPVTQPLYHEKAAISIIRAFERTHRCVDNPIDNVHYYTFGWSGALSEKKRNKESGDLYLALIDIQKDLKNQYPDCIIRFELFAHSHGGQLIAHLPIVHKNFPEHELFIDLAVLCATPLYKEKIQPMISSSLFGTILNIYSCGDSVQTMDFISTPEHYCVRSLQDLNVPLPSSHSGGPVIVDCCLAVHDNTKVFNHHSFFGCSTYPLPSYYRKRSHIRKTLNMFTPMPILVIFPAYFYNIKALELTPGFHSLLMNLRHDNNIFSISTHIQSKDTTPELKNIRYYKAKPLSSRFLETYGKRARHSIFNQVKYTMYHIIHN